MNISKIGFSGMLKLTKPTQPKELEGIPGKEIIYIPEADVKQAKEVYDSGKCEPDRAPDRIEINMNGGYSDIMSENIGYVDNGFRKTAYTSLEYLA